MTSETPKTENTWKAPNLGMTNEKAVSDGADSISEEGEPAIATGGNGVGKLIISNVAVGARLADLGKTHTGGEDAIKPLEYCRV